MSLTKEQGALAAKQLEIEMLKQAAKLFPTSELNTFTWGSNAWQVRHGNGLLFQNVSNDSKVTRSEFEWQLTTVQYSDGKQVPKKGVYRERVEGVSENNEVRLANLPVISHGPCLKTLKPQKKICLRKPKREFT